METAEVIESDRRHRNEKESASPAKKFINQADFEIKRNKHSRNPSTIEELIQEEMKL